MAQNQKLRRSTSLGVSSMPLPGAVHLLVAPDVVEAIEEPGDPADAALGQADPQLGVAHRQARVEPVDGREHRPAEEEHADGVGRRVRARHRSARRRADVQADDGAGLGARGDERIPVAGVQRRQAEALGQLGEGHRPEPTLDVAPDLVGRELGVEQPRELAGDDPPGVAAGPLVEVPVVRRVDDGEREVGVAHAELVALAGEAGERRREVERRVDAVEVHVVDAGVDVPRAPAHLVEARRLEAQLVAWTADDRVQAHLVVAPVVVQPVLHAVVVDLHPGGAIGEPARDAALEQVRRLDEVVVDRDERVVAGAARRFGEEGHLLRLLRREEARSALQVVEVDAVADATPGHSRALSHEAQSTDLGLRPTRRRR